MNYSDTFSMMVMEDTLFLFPFVHFHFQEKLQLFLEGAICFICIKKSCFHVEWIQFDSIDDSAKDGGPHFTQCMIGICPLATHSYQNLRLLHKILTTATINVGRRIATLS